jgi:hypothetical protein
MSTSTRWCSTASSAQLGQGRLPVHTLAAAAHAILRDLLVIRDGPASVLYAGEERVQPEHRIFVTTMVNEARSFLKHANRDPDAVLTFNPDWTDFSRYEAIWMHMTLALERFARPNSYLSYLDCGEVPKGVDLPVRPSPSHFRRPPRGHATTRSQTKFAIALEGSRCSDRGDRNDRNTQAALRRVEKTLLSRALRRVAIGSQSRSVRPSCSSSAS